MSVSRMSRKRRFAKIAMIAFFALAITFGLLQLSFETRVLQDNALVRASPEHSHQIEVKGQTRFVNERDFRASHSVPIAFAIASMGLVVSIFLARRD